jgi:hypothetical protein
LNKSALILATIVALAAIGGRPAGAAESVPSNGEWAVFLKPDKGETSPVVSFNLKTLQSFQSEATAKWMPPVCFPDFFLLIDSGSRYEIRKFDTTLLNSGVLKTQGALGFVAKVNEAGRFVAVSARFDEKKSLFRELLIVDIESANLTITKTVSIKEMGYPVPFGSQVFLLSKFGAEVVDLAEGK